MSAKVGTSAPAGESILKPGPEGWQWFVIHSRARCEKKVAEFAQRQRMACYLPLRVRLHRYGARERRFAAPLFAGYLFCLADPQGRQTLRQNRYVANVLDVYDQGHLLHQLRQIEAALQLGDLLEVLPFLESGRRVRVLAGPLKGLEGIVSRVKARTRIVLNVDMIRESVAVEVDSAALGPV